MAKAEISGNSDLTPDLLELRFVIEWLMSVGVSVWHERREYPAAEIPCFAPIGTPAHHLSAGSGPCTVYGDAPRHWHPLPQGHSAPGGQAEPNSGLVAGRDRHPL